MRNLIYTILFLSIIFLISVSCSKKSALPVEEEPEYPSITEMLDGIQTITNPDYPHFGRSRYALIEEISIGEIEKGEEYMLNLPIDVKVDEEGNIGKGKLNSLGNGKQFSLQYGKQNSLFRKTLVMFFQYYRSKNDKEKNVQTDSRLKEKGLYQEGNRIPAGDRPKNGYQIQTDE